MKEEHSLEPTELLLLISELEGSYHHLRVNGFNDDKDVIREMCNRYYKMYFKLKRERNGL